MLLTAPAETHFTETLNLNILCALVQNELGDRKEVAFCSRKKRFWTESGVGPRKVQETGRGCGGEVVMGGSLARGEFGAFGKVKGHSRGLLTLLKVKWVLSRRITF